MSDAALIEAYLAKGGQVTRCPTGKSALTLEYVYVEGRGIIAKDPEASKRAYRGTMQRHFAKPKAKGPTPEQIKRREAVAGMLDAGQTGADMARTLGVNVQTVYNDARVMGRTLPRPVTRPAITAKVANRRAGVAKLAKEGLSARAIAQRLGCRPQNVWDDAARLGVKFDPKATIRKRTGPAPSGEVAARREKLKAMLPQGMTSYQLADALGVSRSVVFHDCATLGLRIPNQRKKEVAA